MSTVIKLNTLYTINIHTLQHVRSIKMAMRNASISGCLVEPCSDELVSFFIFHQW